MKSIQSGGKQIRILAHVTEQVDVNNHPLAALGKFKLYETASSIMAASILVTMQPLLAEILVYVADAIYTHIRLPARAQ